MKIRVRLFSSLKVYNPSEKGLLDMDVQERTTVLDLLHQLSIPEKVAKISLVNGQYAENTRLLEEGDEITLFPPFAGG
jgi:molybdopterin converting factor small subunit